MIEIEKIKKYYGDNLILNDIDVTFPKQKMIAFIGSNGAGKSTLLSIIGRTTNRQQGEIIIDDKKLEDWKHDDLAKHLSILQQQNHILLKLTVEDLVSFGRFPYSQGKLKDNDWEKVNEAIQYMGLEDIRSSYIDELSGGQRQMAYIAMTIAQDTEYIFLDEPLNNLDMKHSVEIMMLLEKLVKERGKTILIVVHDINYVSCYSDYVVALKDGKIFIEGNTSDVLTSKNLKEIYDIDIQIHTIDGKQFCLYYK